MQFPFFKRAEKMVEFDPHTCSVAELRDFVSKITPSEVAACAVTNGMSDRDIAARVVEIRKVK